MRLPKSVIIFGEEYKIEMSSDLEEATEGITHFDDKLIQLNTNLPKDKILRVLIHEMGHAMFFRNGFDQGIHVQMEEAVVQSFAKLITETFELKIKKRTR